MATAIAPTNVSRSNAEEIAFQMANQPFKLDVTKTAVIADFEGPLRRYRVRNFVMVGSPVRVG